MEDLIEVKTEPCPAKSGPIVIYSSESFGKMTVIFIPKTKAVFTLIAYEIYDSIDEKLKNTQALSEQIHENPVKITCNIPVDNSTRFYEAKFLITGVKGISFNVSKTVVVIFVDKDMKSLEPAAPYKPVKLPALNFSCKTVKLPWGKNRGLPEKHFTNVRIAAKRRTIDSRLHDMCKDSLLRNCPVLSKVLTPENYVEKMKLMIDLCLKTEYSNVNMVLNSYYNISFVREDDKTDIFEFEMNTDELYVGAFLYVYERDGDSVSPIRYEGRVKDLNSDFATLEFPKKFLQIFNPDKEFYLHYEPTNFNAFMMHAALDLIERENFGDVIFPKGIIHKSHEDSLKLNFFNKQMKDNEEQQMAIQQVFSQQNCRAPFIVFGPPGTGKTTTILEAIKQVYTMKKDAKILVCAPFNKHVDEITMKLMEFIPKAEHKKTLHRCYASTYNPAEIPKKIKTITNLVTDQKELKNPGIFESYQIVLTTLITAGRFALLRYKGHFSHIFVDEAGFATEAETLVPLVGQIDENTRIILAGDPKQLDPVFKSEQARNAGYDVPLIERLMESNSNYRNTMVIKLLNNYRSHPAIIKIPNELFYDNELKACADVKEYSRFCSWPHLLQKDFPVIFHDVFSQEVREKSDPSFFNLKEIEVVYSYVDKLLKTQGVKQTDIGIIVTYRKQALKITEYLEKKSIKNVTVGTVEMFLSSEKEVTIISTVRSSLNDEEESSVGFLKNPKRFNVALTRAKALQIVVGNAQVLKQVPSWESFISYCQVNNSFIEDKLRKEKKKGKTKK
ncbi:putative helicase mov-10-B.1 [Octopus bimaculoides]|uniref:AAA+ ATPase domain-containing protein n=1 Tax=Octopus bimaculoides TaxID=37653 RepID=A0A0L8GWW5_OCTBM|nr:putative helicase mov-10-B.1 [Octopus bimaculoides]|eukprot:XP_014777485.1 PREDICTED: putative helicase mov-10-B.1 isoform X2 [Octopus bimaculoides]